MDLRLKSGGFLDLLRRLNAAPSFLRPNGVLVVAYGAAKAADDEVGKVIGVQQCSHQIGSSRNFISPTAWERKSAMRNIARLTWPTPERLDPFGQNTTSKFFETAAARFWSPR
jgi:hypothetical protein